jgi:hypothetical protein
MPFNDNPDRSFRYVLISPVPFSQKSLILPGFYPHAGILISFSFMALCISEGCKSQTRS